MDTPTQHSEDSEFEETIDAILNIEVDVDDWEAEDEEETSSLFDTEETCQDMANETVWNVDAPVFEKSIDQNEEEQEITTKGI